MLAGVLLVSSMSAQSPASLTATEQAAGWKLLFDGTSLSGWRGYKTDTPPTGWTARGGELIREGAGGDLMTVEQYGDFELRFDWKVTANGNSGVIYRIATTEQYPWQTGAEYQVLHNGGSSSRWRRREKTTNTSPSTKAMCTPRWVVSRNRPKPAV